MMLGGLGDAVTYGPTDAQLGVGITTATFVQPDCSIISIDYDANGNAVSTGLVSPAGTAPGCTPAATGTPSSTPKSPTQCSWYQEVQNGKCAVSPTLMLAGLVAGFIVVARMR